MSDTAGKVVLEITTKGWTFRHFPKGSMVAVFAQGREGDPAPYDMYPIPDWVVVTHMNADALDAVAQTWLTNHAPAWPGPRPDEVNGAPELIIGQSRIRRRPQRHVEYQPGEPITSPLIPGLVLEFLKDSTLVIRCQGDVFPLIRPTASNTFEVYTETLLDVAKRQEARA